MKTIVCFLVIGIIALGSFGCVTMKEGAGELGFPKPPIVVSNEDVDAVLTAESSVWIVLELKNKTDKVIVLENDLASFTYPGGQNTKLAPDGTRYIDANKPFPEVTIPPKSNFNIAFFAVESIYYTSGEYGGWGSSSWVPQSLEGTSFTFAYKIDGIEKFIVFSGNEISKIVTTASIKIGTITHKEIFWNILFLYSVENRRSYLLSKAKEDAVKIYGPDIQLINIEYTGSWNALSLILDFSLLGFVEDAAVTADVIRISLLKE
jgi:hypothetical protein